LVREALHERGVLQRNAPHIVHDLPFVIPGYHWWEKSYYWLGLYFYRLLAGIEYVGTTRWLSKAQALEQVPAIKAEHLRGGVLYHDGQFDDARLLIHLAMTAAENNAVLLNYAPVIEFLRHASGTVDGVRYRDAETGEKQRATARVLINATGVFCDQVRRLAEPSAANLVTPSQGIHLVFAGRHFPGRAALMVPSTRDGRVLFAIPWHGQMLVGTTDTPIDQPTLEPQPQGQEVDFILATLSDYLATPLARSDVLSVFTGIRPLVRPKVSGQSTAKVSRDHTLHLDASGLLTITGGKWTTYRQMAEDCVDRAIELGKLLKRPCVTEELQIHGYDTDAQRHGALKIYGSDAPRLFELFKENRAWEERLHPALPYVTAEVVWAARQELARSVEDVLARRTRMLFLNARAALECAPKVAAILAQELHRDAAWQESQVQAFTESARNYLLQ
jgi:glycerol-3-phosphate dehydrogenase